jgi:hypothetical protein
VFFVFLSGDRRDAEGNWCGDSIGAEEAGVLNS